MVDLKEFLLHNIKFGGFSLVNCNDEITPIRFTRYSGEDGDWFLESPCTLYKIADVEGDVNEFARTYASELVEEDDIDSYARDYVLPMIVDGILYDIENFQCAPFLPEYVCDVELISERECLEYMLKLL